MDFYGEPLLSDDPKNSELPATDDWLVDYSGPSSFDDMQPAGYVPSFDDEYRNQGGMKSPADISLGRPSLSRGSFSLPYARPSSTLSSGSSDARAPARRGRPLKTCSDSKMANYARNYREMKKNQLAVSEQRNKELTEENLQLRHHNHTLQESLSRLEREIHNLRRVLDQDSSIASIVARMSGRPQSSTSSTPGNDVGVCLHLAGGKMTLEVCEQCSINSRSREQIKDQKPEPGEIARAETPLFNGDFDSIAKFVR